MTKTNDMNCPVPLGFRKHYGKCIQLLNTRSSIMLACIRVKLTKGDDMNGPVSKASNF